MGELTSEIVERQIDKAGRGKVLIRAEELGWRNQTPPLWVLYQIASDIIAGNTMDSRWTDHDGTSWPDCKPSDVIEVERRKSEPRTDQACGFQWLNSNSPYDIIRYRKVTT